MAKSNARSGYISREVVSPSLLAQIDTSRKPKCRFLWSGSGVFIFTGTWLDALAQHAASDGHAANALSFRKSAEQLVACKQQEDLVPEAQVVLVDGEAFLDAMRCLYFLLKQEITHTTNFASLRELAILLSNKTSPQLHEAENVNYTSEMSM